LLHWATTFTRKVNFYKTACVTFYQESPHITTSCGIIYGRIYTFKTLLNCRGMPCSVTTITATGPPELKRKLRERTYTLTMTTGKWNRQITRKHSAPLTGMATHRKMFVCKSFS
jgi:hypothetical protein